MAPGNGADFVQATEQVPTPGGTAFHLQVQLYLDGPPPGGGPGGPGDSAAYTFIVCDNQTCDPATAGVSCVIRGTDSTCFDDTDTVDFLPGDAISIMAYNSAGEPETLNVSWSLDYALASPI